MAEQAPPPTRHGVTIPLPAMEPGSIGALMRQMVFYAVFAIATFLMGHHVGSSPSAVPMPERPFPALPDSAGAAPAAPAPAPTPAPSAVPPRGGRKAAWLDAQSATWVLTIPKGRGAYCQCSGTFLYPPPRDGEYLFLSAAHCVSRAGSHGKVVSGDTGVNYDVHILARSPGPDLCLGLVRTDDALPCARVASEEPAVGADVWHCGFGEDRPRNVEWGRYVRGPHGDRLSAFNLSVSHGDSGSGIFNEHGEVVGVVSCTDFRRHTYGGGVSEINALVDEISHDLHHAGFLRRLLRRPHWLKGLFG